MYAYIYKQYIHTCIHADICIFFLLSNIGIGISISPKILYQSGLNQIYKMHAVPGAQDNKCKYIFKAGQQRKNSIKMSNNM